MRATHRCHHGRPRRWWTISLSLFAFSVLLYLPGCGNGDASHGLVLRALGFFQESADKETAPTVDDNEPDSGRTASLAQTNAIPNDPDNDGDIDGGYVGLQNQQGSTGLTTDGAKLDYRISGSSFAVPSDFFSFSTRVEPSGSSNGGTVFAQIQLVSPSTMNFLRSKSGQLPPPPFQMTVTATIQARSDAGISYLSNPVTYNVTFTN